jgi:hypothetical protein
LIDDLEPAFARIKEGGGEALTAARSTLTSILGKQTADLALAARLPSCYPFREAVTAGGLPLGHPEQAAAAAKLAVQRKLSWCEFRQRNFG